MDIKVEDLGDGQGDYGFLEKTAVPLAFPTFLMHHSTGKSLYFCASFHSKTEVHLWITNPSI